MDDIIEVLKKFPDMWYLGLNQRTQLKGMFPSTFAVSYREDEETGEDYEEIDSLKSISEDIPTTVVEEQPEGASEMGEEPIGDETEQYCDDFEQEEGQNEEESEDVEDETKLEASQNISSQVNYVSKTTKDVYFESKIPVPKVKKKGNHQSKI